MLVYIPVKADENATIGELVYYAEKMLGKDVERLAIQSIYKEGEEKPMYEW